MYGIMERTLGSPNIEAWIKQNGKLLLYDSKDEAQKQVDIWNEKDDDRYFVAEWI